ncbi:hypothetical protein BTJ40_08905 [Microbulbifer sp. A4B17]|uniref:DUF805 domain-containing protein n=1 Tax=Microbulbifer sp. A4B17 TaxID=359370 RepID=UPI000D52B8C4|nr:DUF805 domain-containing protein [Microbulbifer sp. A4B17]AWF80918.1 hypothetical protein BTJ40_08905 [Microbulbifer sp. A4B17]
MTNQGYLDFYFNFYGTVTRRQFWLLFIIPLLFIQFSTGLVLEYGNFDFSDDIWKTTEILLIAIGVPLQLSLIWISLTICCKRLHSSGIPRRMLLVSLPGIGAIWLCAELLLAPNAKKRCNNDKLLKPDDTLYNRFDMQ